MDRGISIVFSGNLSKSVCWALSPKSSGSTKHIWSAPRIFLNTLLSKAALEKDRVWLCGVQVVWDSIIFHSSASPAALILLIQASKGTRPTPFFQFSPRPTGICDSLGQRNPSPLRESFTSEDIWMRSPLYSGSKAAGRHEFLTSFLHTKSPFT